MFKKIYLVVLVVAILLVAIFGIKNMFGNTSYEGLGTKLSDTLMVEQDDNVDSNQTSSSFVDELLYLGEDYDKHVFLLNLAKLYGTYAGMLGVSGEYQLLIMDESLGFDDSLYYDELYDTYTAAYKNGREHAVKFNYSEQDKQRDSKYLLSITENLFKVQNLDKFKNDVEIVKILDAFGDTNIAYCVDDKIELCQIATSHTMLVLIQLGSLFEQYKFPNSSQQFELWFKEYYNALDFILD